MLTFTLAISCLSTTYFQITNRDIFLCFPGGSEVKASAWSVGDPGSIPGLGRSPGEGNGKPLHYSCLENPKNSMKRQEDRTLKDELSRSVGAQHATGDQWRNNSRKNEGMEPKQKQYPAVDVTGDGSKI